MSTRALRLFEGFGVELEYMVVSSRSLGVLAVADEALRAASGEDDYVSDVEQGDITWSNELSAHVIELKTTLPAPTLAPLVERFQRNVERVNTLLVPLGGRLMPSAMHPWMDPLGETKLWPHHYSRVYAAYNRIFNCQGHGWSNVQSVHINLPFAGDAEFARLHAAIRLVLPLLPALAASSPIVEGRLAPQLDARLEMYRHNSRRIPQITGRVVPEPVYSRRDYEQTILEPMYRAIAPLDPEGTLQDEWLNARGAIARFCRNTIEIRVLDVQECPLADLAISAAVVGVLRALVEERWTPLAEQQAWPVEPLEAVLLSTIRDGERAVIHDVDYLRQFGLAAQDGLTAHDVWRRLIEGLDAREPVAAAPWREAWGVLLDEGPLARRIIAAFGEPRSQERLVAVYRRLCDCLASGRMFRAAESG